MWATQCPALELKAGTLHSSVCPHRKVFNHSYLPGFCMHSVYAQPLNIFISAMQPPLEFPNFAVSCGMHSCRSSRGRREVLPWIFCVLGPCSKSRYPMGWGLWLMATLSWKRPPLLFDCSWLPCWNTWELSHTQAPHSFCDLGDPEVWQFYLGFRPTSPPECFSSRDVPHQIGLIKVPVCTPLLYHFLISGLCPPPLQEFIFPYIILDSFLHGTPPTLQNVVTFLFVEL